jgi:hypothetical protein
MPGNPNDRGLTVERKGDGVVARSQYSNVLFGIICSIALIAFGTYRDEGSTSMLDHPFSAAIITVLFLASLFMLLHRTIETSFDPVNQQAVQERIIWFIWRYRRRSYPFSEIAGIGVKKFWTEDGSGYIPVMTLRDDREVRLSYHNDSQSSCAEDVTAICTATGLARLDLPRPDDVHN